MRCITNMLKWYPAIAAASIAWKRTGYVRIVRPTMIGRQGRRM